MEEEKILQDDAENKKTGYSESSAFTGEDTAAEKAGDDAANDEERQVKKKKPLDIFPRILCVLLAVLIWFYVMQVDRSDYEEEFSGVDVVLSNTSLLENKRNLYVYSGYGNTVDVTVSGKKSIINNYSASDIKITADLKDITSPGEHRVSLSVSLPAGLALSQLDYSDVIVYVDEKKSETFKIKAKVTGANFSNEFEYGDITPEYDSIIVTGPKNVIDTIDYAVVEADFSSLGILKETTSSVRSLSLVDKDGNTVSNPYLKLSRSEVKVTLPVYAEKTVPLTVSYLHGFLNDRNVSVTISPETAVIKGDPAAISPISSINVVQIDEKSLSGNSTLKYTLEDTDGYAIMSEREVTVSIKHVGTVARTYSVTSFDIEAGDNTYEVLDESIDVTLRGSTVSLSNIDSDSITVKADISEYSKDYHGVVRASAEIYVKSAGSDVVYEVGTYSLQIKVN